MRVANILIGGLSSPRASPLAAGVCRATGTLLGFSMRVDPQLRGCSTRGPIAPSFPGASAVQYWLSQKVTVWFLKTAETLTIDVSAATSVGSTSACRNLPGSDRCAFENSSLFSSRLLRCGLLSSLARGVHRIRAILAPVIRWVIRARSSCRWVWIFARRADASGTGDSICPTAVES